MFTHTKQKELELRNMDKRLKRLEEAEKVIIAAIGLHRSLRKKTYKKFMLFSVPKDGVRVPYEFYLN